MKRTELYQIVADGATAKHHQLRMIDESGEDCLYPEEYFAPVQLPQAAEKAVLRAVNQEWDSTDAAYGSFSTAA